MIKSSFKLALVSVSLLVLVIITILINPYHSVEVSTYLVGLPLLISFIISIIGIVFIVISSIEKKTKQFIFALSTHLFFFFLILILLIINLIDIKNSL